MVDLTDFFVKVNAATVCSILHMTSNNQWSFLPTKRVEVPAIDWNLLIIYFNKDVKLITNWLRITYFAMP